MKALAWGAGTVGVILTLYGMAQAIDAHGNAQAAMAEALREACLPRPGQTVVIVSDGRRAQCRVYTSASMAPGMARQLISAAVVDIEVQP